jgi:hypothetical protein
MKKYGNIFDEDIRCATGQVLHAPAIPHMKNEANSFEER